MEEIANAVNGMVFQALKRVRGLLAQAQLALATGEIDLFQALKWERGHLAKDCHY